MTKDSVLHLRVFGGVSLSRSGDRLSEFLAGPKRTAVLVYLALGDPEQVYERDEILAVFWPEAPEARARAALRQLVHVLRRELGADLVESEGTRVRLRPGVVACDAADFERLRRSDPEAALARYHGDFLEGFHLAEAPLFYEWVEDTRRRLRRQAAEAARGLADQQSKNGNADGAIRALRRLLELSPFDEEGVRALMRLFVERGSYGEAAETYYRFAARLRAEFGIEPAVETTELLEQADGDLASVGGGRWKPRMQAPEGSAHRRIDRSSLTAPAQRNGDVDLEDSAQPAADGRRTPEPIAPPKPAWTRAVTAVPIGLLLVAGAWAITAEVHEPVDVPAPIRVAVAPFNELGSPDSAYFAIGLTDELIHRLASAPGFEVVSTEPRGAGDPAEDPAEEAQALGARYVVLGTVRREGEAEAPDRIRVTPRVVRLRDRTEVWTESFDTYLEDIFGVQDRIAQAITEAMGGTLAVEPGTGEAPTRDPTAHAFYLRGWTFLKQEWLGENLALAARMFERATEADPRFADAWAGLSLASSELHMGNWSAYNPRDRAVAAARRAMELDSESAYGHLAMAMVHYRIDRDYKGAEDHLREAEARRPGDPEILIARAYVARRRGDWESAVRLHRRALDREPRVARGRAGFAWTLIPLRRYRDADRHMIGTLELFPEMPGFYGTASQVRLIGWGDREGARALLETAEARLDEPRTGEDWFLLELYDRRYAQALASIAGGGAQAQVDRATVLGLMDEPRRATATYDSVRVVLENATPGDDPTRADHASLLALVHAATGRDREAVELGRTAVDLIPVVRDALQGPRLLERLARVYAMTGDHERSIGILEELLAQPSQVSAHTLALDPRYDGLRSHPDFVRLLEDSRVR